MYTAKLLTETMPLQALELSMWTTKLLMEAMSSTTTNSLVETSEPKVEELAWRISAQTKGITGAL